ncbi:hypothetical protein CLOM_g19856 [Closterium sp. NIES-68]|nr:hypothetical protein CLOM_g19856 [Closterium sp. NIES-68]
MGAIDAVNPASLRPPSVRVRLNQPSYAAGEAVILTVDIENRSAQQAGRQRDQHQHQNQHQQQQQQWGVYAADGRIQLESLSVEVKGVIRSATPPPADTTWTCNGDVPCLVARPLRLAIHAPLVPGCSKSYAIEIPLPINALPSGRMVGNDSLAPPLTLPLPLHDASDPPAPLEPASAAVLYLVSVSADWRGISAPGFATSATSAAAGRPVELLAWFKVKPAAGTISHATAPPSTAFNPACPPCARLSAHERPYGRPSAALASPHGRSPFRLPQLTTPTASAFPPGSSLPPTPTPVTPSPGSNPPLPRRLLPHLSAPRERTSSPSLAPPCADDVEAVSVAAVLPCDVSSSRFGAWGWAHGQGNSHGTACDGESCFGDKHMREAEADEAGAAGLVAAGAGAGAGAPATYGFSKAYAPGSAMHMHGSAAAAHVHGLADVPEERIVAHSSGSSSSVWGGSSSGSVTEWREGGGLVETAAAIAGVATGAAAAAAAEAAAAAARAMRRSRSDDAGMPGQGRRGYYAGGYAEGAEGEEEGEEDAYSSSSSAEGSLEGGLEGALDGNNGASDQGQGNRFRTMSLPARRLPDVPLEGLLAPEHDQEVPRQLLSHCTMMPHDSHGPTHAHGAHGPAHVHGHAPLVCHDPTCHHTSCDAMPVGSPADCLNWEEVEAFCRNMDSARVRIESIDIQHEPRKSARHGVATHKGLRVTGLHGQEQQQQPQQGQQQGQQQAEGKGNGQQREREEAVGMEACSRVLFAVKFQGMSLWHYPASDSVKPLFRMAS